jgi:3',5'-cyclic AMP phosphodiesterase CpdA
MDSETPALNPPSRRRALQCLAWAGTGLLWAVSGGVPRPLAIGEAMAAAPAEGFTFVQISDSHIGFNKDANPDPNATLKAALDRVAGLPKRPAMMLHTGDVSHLSKPAQFDTAAQMIGGAGLETHYVPGEHDVIGDDGKAFFERFGKQALPGGWYSFDQGGVHFVALNNVQGFAAAQTGGFGSEQLEWLESDLKVRSASTPVVVFTHIPMWPVFPKWGWATPDAPQALGYLKRFGSVTVLNGHIHQVVQKVEGNVVYRTAMSTAFPQPAPGQGPSPGPLKVPAGQLRSVLGIREVSIEQDKAASISDSTLA